MTDRSRRAHRLVPLLVLTLAAVGCAGAGAGAGQTSPGAATATSPADPSGPTASADPTEAASDAPSADPSASIAPAVTLDQVWATTQLTDVASGQPFRIADHAGSVIIIETMAIWCTNCRVQQDDVQTALARLPADNVVYIVLDVDPNEDAASLADYQVQHGYKGRYAIAETAVARALATEFGDLILNPPSTPMIVVGTDGTVTMTEFGHKSVDEIVALAESHGA